MFLLLTVSCTGCHTLTTYTGIHRHPQHTLYGAHAVAALVGESVHETELEVNCVRQRRDEKSGSTKYATTIAVFSNPVVCSRGVSYDD